MRTYELMLLLDPTLSDDRRASLFGEIREELARVNVTISSEENWGERDLAYRVNNSKTGFYAIWQLESNGQGFFDLTKNLNLKKALWRFVFVKTGETAA